MLVDHAPVHRPISHHPASHAAVLAALESSAVLTRTINVRYQRTWERQAFEPQQQPTVDVEWAGEVLTYVPSPHSYGPDLVPLGDSNSAEVGHGLPRLEPDGSFTVPGGLAWPWSISVDITSPIGSAMIAWRKQRGNVRIPVDPTRIRTLGRLRTSSHPYSTHEGYYASYDAGVPADVLCARGYYLGGVDVVRPQHGYWRAGDCDSQSVAPVVEWLRSLRALPQSGDVIDTTPRPRVRQVRDPRAERSRRKARRGW